MRKLTKEIDKTSPGAELNFKSNLRDVNELHSRLLEILNTEEDGGCIIKNTIIYDIILSVLRNCRRCE